MAIRPGEVNPMWACTLRAGRTHVVDGHVYHRPSEVYFMGIVFGFCGAVTPFMTVERRDGAFPLAEKLGYNKYAN